MAKVDNRFRNLLAQIEMETGKRPTYREISDETNIAISTLSAWGNGKIKRYDDETLTKLVDFFNHRLIDGCRLGDLLEYPPANGQDIPHWVMNDEHNIPVI